MKGIKTSNAQSAPGLLSQAIVSGDLVFTAGFIHITPEGEMVHGSVTEMFERVIMNVEETLKAAGSTLEKVVKVTLYVTDITTLGELNKAYMTYFNDPMPVREAVGVKELPLGAKIEMSVVATI